MPRISSRRDGFVSKVVDDIGRDIDTRVARTPNFSSRNRSLSICARFSILVRASRISIDLRAQRREREAENLRGTTIETIGEECVVMLRGGSSTESSDGGWCGTESGNGHEETKRAIERVHRQLKRVQKAKGKIETHEIKLLREADKLRLWREYGCTSLVDYMERELGYLTRPKPPVA